MVTAIQLVNEGKGRAGARKISLSVTKNISNKKCLNAFKTIFETLLRGEEREYYEIIVKSVLTCMFSGQMC